MQLLSGIANLEKNPETSVYNFASGRVRRSQIPAKPLLLSWNEVEILRAENKISLRRQFYQNKVFVVNTEPFDTFCPIGFKTEKLITVAGGIKWTYLAKYLAIDDPKKILVIDQSNKALEFVKELSFCSKKSEIIQIQRQNAGLDKGFLLDILNENT